MGKKKKKYGKRKLSKKQLAALRKGWAIMRAKRRGKKKSKSAGKRKAKRPHAARKPRSSAPKAKKRRGSGKKKAKRAKVAGSFFVRELVTSAGRFGGFRAKRVKLGRSWAGITRDSKSDRLYSIGGSGGLRPGRYKVSSMNGKDRSGWFVEVRKGQAALYRA
ncbi:MAG: hypothetical protein L6Q71_10905, partial [Planctomycetes bacterium]|nr:hypothetical protein [Planctomycetota bacterium]NUQ33358.1 hypothetical protein [Planctomycetaceae bacterium]